MLTRSRARALRVAWALGVFAAASPHAARAAALPAVPSPAPSESPSTAEIGRVFTSDRSIEASSTTTRPTFVVDRATIEAFGYHTIAEALAAVPGVDLHPYGAFGAQTNYGIRGATSTATLVLQDGVPIATGSNGTVDLGSLPTAGVQRIEVVESAASTLYGSSATGGVIDIITTAAAPQPYARVAGGTYGNGDVAVQAGSGAFALTYQRHIASNVYDYPAFAYPGGNATPAGTRTNDDAQQTALRFSGLAQLGGGWTARLTASDTTMNLGVPGDLAYLTPDARQGTNRRDALLDIAHLAGAGTLHLTLSGVAQNLTYADVPDLGGEQDTFDGRSQASLRYTASGTRTDVVTGVDLARESAVLTFPPSEQPPATLGAAQSQAAAYVQAGYDPSDRVRFIAGLRGENDGPQGSVAAPSFGMLLKFGPARLSANVSESFEAPTLVDLYYPGYSNPSLVPEKLTNFDATIGLPGLLGGVTFGTFGRDGSNLIVLDPTTFVPYNASRVSVNGLQFTASSPAIRGLRATLGVTNVYRALDTSTGLRLPSTSPIVATLGVERAFGGSRFAYGATLRIVGSSPDVPNPNGGAALADPYDGYTVANAYLRYRVGAQAIVSARVQNLGNAAYAPIYGYPAPGRAFELELATR